MKKVFLLLLILMTFFSCASVETEPEEPDYIINDAGVMIFKDWDTAFEYARENQEIAVGLYNGVIYAAQQVYENYKAGLITEEEASNVLDELKQIHDKLLEIILYHEQGVYYNGENI